MTEEKLIQFLSASALESHFSERIKQLRPIVECFGCYVKTKGAGMGWGWLGEDLGRRRIGEGGVDPKVKLNLYEDALAT